MTAAQALVERGLVPICRPGISLVPKATAASSRRLHDQEAQASEPLLSQEELLLEQAKASSAMIFPNRINAAVHGIIGDDHGVYHWNSSPHEGKNRRTS